MYPYSWTIYFDTIYAAQDREDDTRVGILSTARLFGSRIREISAYFAGAVVALMIYGGVLNENGVMYFGVTCGGAACHFLWQLSQWDPSQGESSEKVFKVCQLPLQRCG